MACTLVTGAGRGIGLEFVRQCLRRGDHVFAGIRRPDPPPALAGLASQHCDRLAIVSLDLAREESIRDAAALVASRTDALDLLVNNAGLYSLSATTWSPGGGPPLGQLTMAELVEVFRVNAAGPILLAQALWPLLARGTHPVILNLSSLIGSLSAKTGGGDYAYAASKAALNMLTRALAADLAPHGIIAVAISPGWVRTDMGGPSASLPVDESVAGLLATAGRLTPRDSGCFLDYLGRPMPW
ncbi:MAG: SDR family oxidoreductase [Gemmatimonadota bacterium]